jgi:hypothetical protein
LTRLIAALGPILAGLKITFAAVLTRLIAALGPILAGLKITFAAVLTRLIATFRPILAGLKITFAAVLTRLVITFGALTTRLEIAFAAILTGLEIGPTITAAPQLGLIRRACRSVGPLSVRLGKFTRLKVAIFEVAAFKLHLAATGTPGFAGSHLGLARSALTGTTFTAAAALFANHNLFRC